MPKQKTQVANPLTEEAASKIRCYLITREVDSSTKTFENALAGLKREFDFDMEMETYSTAEL